MMGWTEEGSAAESYERARSWLLEALVFLAAHSRLKQDIEVAKAIKFYWHGAVSFITSQITTGAMEGLNSKIKREMKRTYGFNDVAPLRTIVYPVARKLCIN